MHHHIPIRRPRALTLASIALLVCAGSSQAQAMQSARASTRCVAPLWTAVADIVPAPYAVRVAPGIDPHTLLAWRSPSSKGCRATAEVEHDWPAAETPWADRLRAAASSAGLAVIVGPATERVQIFPGLDRYRDVRFSYYSRKIREVALGVNQRRASAARTGNA